MSVSSEELNSTKVNDSNVPTSGSLEKAKADANYRFKAGLFLASVTGVSAFVGFGMTLAAAKKKDPRMFEKGVEITKGLEESGMELALRALKWGTIYAVSGTSLLCFSIWKLSGAKTMEEFRMKMGSILPKVPKNEKPLGRTEFAGLTDLLTYISGPYQTDVNKSKET